MSIVGAIGAILAGVVLGGIGYGGLALVVGIAVVAVAALSPLAWRRQEAQIEVSRSSRSAVPSTLLEDE